MKVDLVDATRVRKIRTALDSLVGGTDTLTGPRRVFELCRLAHNAMNTPLHTTSVEEAWAFLHDVVLDNAGGLARHQDLARTDLLLDLTAMVNADRDDDEPAASSSVRVYFLNNTENRLERVDDPEGALMPADSEGQFDPDAPPPKFIEPFSMVRFATRSREIPRRFWFSSQSLAGGRVRYLIKVAPGVEKVEVSLEWAQEKYVICCSEALSEWFPLYCHW
jgi:hypothetical protein